MTSYIKHFTILILAGSICYFSYTLSKLVIEIAKTREAIPQLVEQASTLEQSIKVSQWLNVANDLTQQLPSVVTQISQVNKQIPDIVSQIDTLQKTTIPSVLSEVKIVREQVVPPLLEQVELTNKTTIPQVLAESKQLRIKTIPEVIKESSEIRALTPSVLSRVEVISDNTEKIVSKATASAVEGTVKGVIATPFSILGDIGDRVIPNKENDNNEE
ncbi:hypothetical protein MACH09_05040 [Vibrio sp. MACH09]|uniref:hypothetical protein n=1 Tax=Vibrio sp. MACH09 TaxID=3025122 RepID=UPI00278DA15C|nr:hypothetical protein [Vibrio sp. MACH09]GLO59996.1 hypothetical protein MACH09_05040 [Vibrio sp. MACH09]